MNYISILFIFLGLMLGAIVLPKPYWSIWLLACWTMVISGVAIFFVPSLATIQWGAVILSMVLLFQSIWHGLRYKKKVTGRPPAFFIWFCLFFFFALISSFGNMQIKQFVFSAKNFFQFWSVPIALYLIVNSEKKIARYMFFFLVLAILMPPLAICQYKFFTDAYTPGDAVTGTFGGTIAGGGPNAAFSLFMASQIAVLLAMALKKVLSWKKSLFISFWIFIPLLITNAKVIVIALLIMFLYLFGKQMLKFSVAGILGLLIVSVMVGSITFYYYMNAWRYSKVKYQPKTITEFIDNSINGNISLEKKNRINRATIYLLWWNDTYGKGKITQLFFGYGLGASKETGLVPGYIASRPEFRGLVIGRTTLAGLLWDVGIVGAFTFGMIFISAFYSAWKMQNDKRLPVLHQALMASTAVVCLFVLLCFPYKQFVNVQAFNFFTMFNIGYIAFWHRRLRMIDET